MPSAFAPRPPFFDPVWWVPLVLMVTSVSMPGDRFGLARLGLVRFGVAQCGLDAAFGDRAHLVRQALAKLVQAVDRKALAARRRGNAVDRRFRGFDTFGRHAFRLTTERVTGVAEHRLFSLGGWKGGSDERTDAEADRCDQQRVLVPGVADGLAGLLDQVF